jgi:hypothetical protein
MTKVKDTTKSKEWNEKYDELRQLKLDLILKKKQERKELTKQLENVKEMMEKAKTLGADISHIIPLVEEVKERMEKWEDID